MKINDKKKRELDKATVRVQKQASEEEVQMHADIDAIANRLIIIRNSEGISQKEFAKRLGISQSMLSYIENGQRAPNLQMIQKASQFGYPVEWILNGEDNAEPTIQNKRQKDIASIAENIHKLSNREVHFVRQWIELFVQSQQDEKDEGRKEG